MKEDLSLYIEKVYYVFEKIDLDVDIKIYFNEIIRF